MSNIVFNLLIKIAGTFLAIFGFAIVLEVPKKHALNAAFIGGVGGLAYWFSIENGAGDILASFFSALLAAMLSHVFARINKVPVTTFLVGGVIPVVPGAGMYRTVSSFIAENEAMTTYYLSQTIQAAAVIALAIFIVDSLFGSPQTSFVLLEKNEQEDFF